MKFRSARRTMHDASLQQQQRRRRHTTSYTGSLSCNSGSHESITPSLAHAAEPKAKQFTQYLVGVPVRVFGEQARERRQLHQRLPFDRKVFGCRRQSQRVHIRKKADREGEGFNQSRFSASHQPSIRGETCV